jgi:hypothetical protein
MSGVHLTDQDVVSEERRVSVLAELSRILDSPSFRGSRRCCRLLEYSVHQVLKGATPEGLKERTIGIEALQRPADYDTSEDAIVRVTANEVRKRLAQYYQGAETQGSPAISLPPGSYAVTFHWPPTVAPPVVVEPVRVEPARSDRKWVVLLLVGLAVIGGILWFWTARNRAAARPTPAPQTKADPLWSRVFNPGQKTNIVISDTVYREIQYFLGRDLSLSEYLSPGYPSSLVASAKPEMRSTIEFLGQQQTTSVGSAAMGSRLLVFGLRQGGNPVIRYPRHINAREFRTDNFILLGSRLSVPWEELFVPSLNFPLVTDTKTHDVYLLNRSPRPRESADFRESSNNEETYADIAVLPNLGGNGTVLILNGIDMVAAEAAGEFAMGGSISAAARSRFIEVLIRVKAIGGTVASMEIAAMRDTPFRNPSAQDAAKR